MEKKIKKMAINNIVLLDCDGKHITLSYKKEHYFYSCLQACIYTNALFGKEVYGINLTWQTMSLARAYKKKTGEYCVSFHTEFVYD